MSMHERTGTRDLTYSAWHRPANIKAFLGDGRDAAYRAAALTVIDIDWCEYCPVCSAPLALIETQHSSRPPKEAAVTALLGQRNPTDPLPVFSVSHETDTNGMIVAFRRRQLSPERTLAETVTPEQYARWLYQLRVDHGCIKPR